MNDIMPEEKSPTTTKHRRSDAEIREEHKQFIELYKSGLTTFEIMRNLSISKAQYKKHFADAIIEGDINLATYTYGTCFGKHLPEAICVILQATKDDLIRFESINKNNVTLVKV